MASKRRFVSISERIRQLRPDADPELLISAGLVEVDRRQVTNPRMLVSISSSVRLKATKDLRGATKLRGALDVLALDVRDSVALDVGAAAGGFTWALLQAGVRHVYAVDIGYGQLVGFLRQSPHVTVLERTNLAELTPHLIPERLDLITLEGGGRTASQTHGGAALVFVLDGQVEIRTANGGHNFRGPKEGSGVAPGAAVQVLNRTSTPAHVLEFFYTPDALTFETTLTTPP